MFVQATGSAVCSGFSSESSSLTTPMYLSYPSEQGHDILSSPSHSTIPVSETYGHRQHKEANSAPDYGEQIEILSYLTS